MGPKAHRHDHSNGSSEGFPATATPWGAAFEAGRRWGFPAMAFILAATFIAWQAYAQREDSRAFSEARSATETKMIEQLIKVSSSMEQMARNVEGLREDVRGTNAKLEVTNTKLEGVQRSLERRGSRDRDP